MIPSVLHPTLFLAQMMAREGNFPPRYLDGFQRLVDDVLDEMAGELTTEQQEEIKFTVKQIISDARGKAGLE